MPRKKSSKATSFEKHCYTCTCGQNGIKWSTFFIKQNISQAPPEYADDKETIESVLKLLGHSQTTIKQVLESRNITPQSSSVYSKELNPRNNRPSMESTKEDEGYLCEKIENKTSMSNIMLGDHQTPLQNNMILWTSMTETDIVTKQRSSLRETTESNDHPVTLPITKKSGWQSCLCGT